MSSPAEIAAGTAVELFLLALAVGLLYRVWGRFLPVPQKQRVLAFQRGVVLLGESVEKVLGPGSYWITPKRTLLICDMRPKPFQVQSQELLTSDGMGIRVSLGGEYRITAPALFTTENSDAFGAFYLELRQALRVSAGEVTGESLLGNSLLLTDRIKELLVPRAAHLGLEMTQLDVWEIVPVGWLRAV